MIAFCGLMVMDCKTAGPTFSMPEPETEPTVAVMVELPTLTAVASPELLTVTTLPDEEVQVAKLVTSCVVLSVKVAVAVNCWVVPAGIVALEGVTAIELMIACVTVTEVEPVIKPEVAEMFAEPMPFPLTRPFPFAATKATVGSSEFHSTGESVCVLPSVNVPTGVSCTVVPRAMDGFDGFKTIETSAAGNTVKPVLPLTDPYVALIVTVPVAKVCADPELSIETFVKSEELHTADAKSCVSPLLKTPVAVKLWLTPNGIEALSGVTRMAVRVGAVTCKLDEPLMDPYVAVTDTVPIARPVVRPVLSMDAIDPGADQLTSCV